MLRFNTDFDRIDTIRHFACRFDMLEVDCAAAAVVFRGLKVHTCMPIISLSSLVESQQDIKFTTLSNAAAKINRKLFICQPYLPVLSGVSVRWQNNLK